MTTTHPPKTQDYVAQAKALADEFALTAAERDKQGGTPQHERDRIRASGLLALVIPTQYGGLGQSWVTAQWVTRELAKADSSLAHVFSYHHLGVILPALYGTAEQRDRYYTETARHQWYWGNAINPLDLRLQITPDGEHYRLNGKKSFCSGSVDSDLLPTTAVQPGVEGRTTVVVPSRREGVTIHHDWDNMGQRQTDSGSVTFDNVLVYPDEILLAPQIQLKPYQTLRTCLAQLNLANIYVGIAQGAFAAAQHYTRTQTKPWFTSGVASATQDPHILKHYGELWVSLQAADALVLRAAEQAQHAWETGMALTAQERGALAIAIATAKAAATQTSLTVTSRIFELMGARATSAHYGFDRFWRNARTFTLHDPIDYKLQDIGNWVLNQEFPQPSSYS